MFDRWRFRGALEELTATPEQKVARAKWGIFWRIVCMIFLAFIMWLLFSLAFGSFLFGGLLTLGLLIYEFFFRSASK